MPVRYSIKDLEKLSGVKAHTLRIWEQRYNLLRPNRTETNIRYYTDSDLKKILNVALLNNKGKKISQIAELSDSELSQEVDKLVSTYSSTSDQIEGLSIAMIEMDELRFEKIISNSILHFGFERTIEEIVFPFLRQVGIMWQVGVVNPAQEHFITQLIRQKLIVGIDGVIPKEIKNQKCFIIFLPSGEMHELSILYYYYLIKAYGHKCYYLSQSVPMEDLKTVYSIRKADMILSVITMAFDHISSEEYVKLISKTFSDSKILLSGTQVIKIESGLPKNVKVFLNPTDLRNYL